MVNLPRNNVGLIQKHMSKAADVASVLNSNGVPVTDLTAEDDEHVGHVNVKGKTPAAATRFSAPVHSRNPITAENPVPNTKTQFNVGEGSGKGNASDHGPLILDMQATSALMALHTSIHCTMENERVRLIMAGYDVCKPVKMLRHSVNEERERLKFLEPKVAEKSGSHSRAAAGHKRALDVMNQSKRNLNRLSRTPQYSTAKALSKVGEDLVDSWASNKASAYSRLERWEFKLRRQRERVEKLKSELIAEEALLKEKNRKIDTSLKELQALGIVLSTL